MIRGKSIEHLGRALRVANICNFLLVRHLPHEVNLSNSVVVAEFLEAELPEQATLVRIKRLVAAAKGRPAVVTQPHIIPLANHLKRRRDVRIVYDPGRHTRQQTMLEEHYRGVWPSVLLVRDTIHRQYVAVFRFDFVLLVLEASILNNLLKRLEVLGGARPGPVAVSSPINCAILKFADLAPLVLLFLSAAPNRWCVECVAEIAQWVQKIKPPNFLLRASIGESNLLCIEVHQSHQTLEVLVVVIIVKVLIDFQEWAQAYMRIMRRLADAF